MKRLPAVCASIAAILLFLRAVYPQLVGPLAPVFLAGTNAASGPTPFSPDQLTNLLLWLNGDYQVTQNGNTNNAPVALYYDKTTNLNHGFTNLANGLPVPTAVTNQLNGHAIVRFVGSNSYNIKTNFLAGVLQGELWFVAKALLDPAGAAKGTLFRLMNTNQTGGDEAYPEPTTAGRVQDNFLSSQLFYWRDTPGIFSNAFHIVSIFTKTNEMILSVDGDFVQGGSKIWPGAISNCTIGINSGSSGRWFGDLADVYVFGYQNSELNRSNMVAYLASLYGLTLRTNIFTATAADTNIWNLTNSFWTNGMYFWYCATNFNGQTNNAPVGGTGRFWTDQGPLGNHGTNATAANQPLFQSNIFGTLPGVLFDGVNDRMNFIKGTLSLVNTNDFTMLFIHMPTNITTARPIAGVAAGGGGGTDFRVNHNTENRLAVRSSVASVVSATASGELIPTAALNGQTVMQVFARTNGVWKFYSNLQQAFEVTAGENRTNRAAITMDAIGFTTDFTVGYSGRIYAAVCWTNRFIDPRDLMNMYRLTFKSEVSVLP